MNPAVEEACGKGVGRKPELDVNHSSMMFKESFPHDRTKTMDVRMVVAFICWIQPARAHCHDY